MSKQTDLRMSEIGMGNELSCIYVMIMRLPPCLHSFTQTSIYLLHFFFLLQIICPIIVASFQKNLICLGKTVLGTSCRWHVLLGITQPLINNNFYLKHTHISWLNGMYASVIWLVWLQLSKWFQVDLTLMQI